MPTRHDGERALRVYIVVTLFIAHSALSAADYSIPSSTRVPLDRLVILITCRMMHLFNCNVDRHNVIGGWEVLVHPSGARYHYNKNMASTCPWVYS
jgi:hypothetical protein